MIRRAIDWADVHRRLEQSQAALSDTSEQSSERVRQILAERTRRMAAVVVDTRKERLALLLVCRLGAERYAMHLGEVAEVAALGALALPPRAPPALLGAMNLRGVVHRVFDLGRLMGGAGLVGAGEPGGHVVVLRRQEFPTGLRVDQAEGIVPILADRLAVNASAHQNCFTKTMVDGLLILDLDKIKALIAGPGK